MNLDDLTLHRFRALKETPQGHPPGAIFEATDDAGAVLVSVGVAERLPDVPAGATKAVYKRRDLRAE